MTTIVSGILGLKGEVYLPQNIRKELDLRPGMSFKLIVENGKLLVEKISNSVSEKIDEITIYNKDTVGKSNLHHY